MSGLEPLAALGLACSIMQTVSFGCETVSLCKRVYQSGAAEPGLAAVSARLAGLSQDLDLDLGGAGRPLRKADQELVDLAKKCAAAANDLREETDFLVAHRAGLRAALGVVAKTAWRRRRLDRLEKTLVDAQRVMETAVLLRLSAKTDALQSQHDEAFAVLDHNLKHFIRQLSDGHTTLSEVVLRGSGEVKDHVTREASRVDQSLRSHVTKELAIRQKSTKEHITSTGAAAQKAIEDRLHRLHNAQEEQRVRQRFIDSLKYPDMNARKNQVKETFPQTFAWIFNIDETDSEETDSEEILSIDQGDGEVSTWGATSHRSEHPRLWYDFVAFLESDEPLYWISGKPGSGKSTLVKFVLARQETREALAKWKEATQLLSHFFWSPGQKMQRCIKGLLCSLLYQVCQTNEGCAETLFGLHRHLEPKEFPADWSETELRDLAMRYFRASATPYCVFLDGLDEICAEDGGERLLDLIQELQVLPMLKICVSSRPEPVFSRRLGCFPSLKIHALTDSDLRTYASSHLPKTGYENHYQDLVGELLRKAQGVFLWLVLAVNSLRRGISNGDSLDDLQQRLKAMPADLTRLYEEMWLRLDEDGVIYLQTASKYFQLMVEAKFGASNYETILFYGRPTIFELAVAGDEAIQTAFVAGKDLPPLLLDRLLGICERTSNDLTVRCAGLLEITDSHKNHRFVSPQDEAIVPFLDRCVDFIHRTAYDFLLTTEGGAIYSSTALSPCPIKRLVRAALIRCSLFQSNDWKLCQQNVRGFLCFLISPDCRLPTDLVMDILRDCQEAYEADHLHFHCHFGRNYLAPYCGSDRSRYRPLFLGLVASLCSSRDIIKMDRLLLSPSGNMAPNPEFLSVALHLFCQEAQMLPTPEMHAQFRRVLDAGALPNFKGHDVFYHRFGPFGYFIAAFHWITCRPWTWDLTSRQWTGQPTYSSGGDKEVLHTLQHLVEAGCDLDSRALVFARCVARDVREHLRAGLYISYGDPGISTTANGVLLEVNLAVLFDLIAGRLDKWLGSNATTHLRESIKRFPRYRRILLCWPTPGAFHVPPDSEEDANRLADITLPMLGDHVMQEEEMARREEAFEVMRLRILRRSVALEEGVFDYLDRLGYSRPTHEDLDTWNIPQFLSNETVGLSAEPA